jgi:hypothetical protein
MVFGFGSLNFSHWLNWHPSEPRPKYKYKDQRPKYKDLTTDLRDYTNLGSKPMIPHPVSDEIFGNGLKDRVSAIRKRLRGSRANQRVSVDDPVEASPAPDSGSQFPADSPAMRQLVNLDLTPVFTGAGEENRDTLHLVGELEVGIT